MNEHEAIFNFPKCVKYCWYLSISFPKSIPKIPKPLPIVWEFMVSILDPMPRKSDCRGKWAIPFPRMLQGSLGEKAWQFPPGCPPFFVGALVLLITGSKGFGFCFLDHRNSVSVNNPQDWSGNLLGGNKLSGSTTLKFNIVPETHSHTYPTSTIYHVWKFSCQKKRIEPPSTWDFVGVTDLSSQKDSNWYNMFLRPHLASYRIALQTPGGWFLLTLEVASPFFSFHTVDGRNPAPLGMVLKPCKSWDKLPTSTG